MSQVLGRGEHQPWATKWPVSSLEAMLIAAIVGIGIFTYCNIEVWTPLQQWYWVHKLPQIAQAGYVLDSGSPNM